LKALTTYYKFSFFAGFEVLTVMTMNIMTFCVITLCSSEKTQHFGRPFISRVKEQTKKPAEADSNLCYDAEDGCDMFL
jgi:hypothetical protein